ncbi:MAG: hypothetical protein APR62_07545 [Smithella sp. SDB]|nr:MAG: hypothetical protein APR62_07545 [Smithella sp. SDB]
MHQDASKRHIQLLNPSELKKPPVSLRKSGLAPKTTKPQASGACGLYLLFLLLKDTERQTP